MKFLQRPTPDVQGYFNELFKWIAGEIQSWTPTPGFATAGDQNIVCSTQFGRYIVFGPLIFYWFNIVTSTFTHTTAAGNFQITGLPHASANITNLINNGSLSFGGITNAASAYTQIVPRIVSNSSTILLRGSGSAVAPGNITTAEMPTGGTVSIVGLGIYFKA